MIPHLVQTHGKADARRRFVPSLRGLTPGVGIDSSAEKEKTSKSVMVKEINVSLKTAG